MPYLKNSIACNHDFWYSCVKWWYLQPVVSLFWNFHFLGCWGGNRVKKMPRMKNNNHILHTPYLKNSITYNHDFGDTGVKWWYLQVFFEIFIFWAVRGVKGQKITQMKNNYIQHAPYIRNSIACDHEFWYTCVKQYLQAIF